MQELKPTAKPGKSPLRVAYEKKQLRRMFLAIVLLLVALTIVLVKHHQFRFLANESPAGEETKPGPARNTAVQARSVPAPKAKKHVAAKGPAEPAVAGSAAIATSRAALPPLEVEVVTGNTQHTVHAGSNSLKVEMPPNSGPGAAGSGPVEAATDSGSARNATERVRMSPGTAQTVQLPGDSYPSLTRQMKVRGSVVLQALVGADGIIRDLRVLSGPAILTTAAREAVRQWRFKPYLQNGQPIETQAKITVNFIISTS